MIKNASKTMTNVDSFINGADDDENGPCEVCRCMTEEDDRRLSPIWKPRRTKFLLACDCDERRGLRVKFWNTRNVAFGRPESSPAPLPPLVPGLEWDVGCDDCIGGPECWCDGCGTGWCGWWWSWCCGGKEGGCIWESPGCIVALLWSFVVWLSWCPDRYEAGLSLVTGNKGATVVAALLDEAPMPIQLAPRIFDDP